MYKKIVATAILLPLIFYSFNTKASAADLESDFLFSNGTITRYIGDSKDVVIPSTISGIRVTSIGDYSFAEKGIVSVFIPDSVTDIGDSAFYGNELTTINLPKSVTYIGQSAFAYNKITALKIPSSIENLSDYAFLNNELTALTIPGSVETIGYFTFARNNIITAVIPDSVTHINNEAFQGNYSLTLNVKKNSTAHLFAVGKGIPYIFEFEKKNDDINVSASVLGSGIHINVESIISNNTFQIGDEPIVTIEKLNYTIYDNRGIEDAYTTHFKISDFVHSRGWQLFVKTESFGNQIT